MVNLTKIYTRTGDGGKTRLSDNSVADKTDSRVDAYGTVDELNSVLGLCLASGGLSQRMVEALSLIQNELFDVGADLSHPLTTQSPWPPLRIEQSSVDRLENYCDEFGADLPNLRSFILPGGSLASSYLHLARTLARRAERQAWRCVEEYGTEVAEPDSEQPGGINLVTVKYLNRLSDLLFIMARLANVGTEHGDILWVPGTDRPIPDFVKKSRRRQQESEPSAK